MVGNVISIAFSPRLVCGASRRMGVRGRRRIHMVLIIRCGRKPRVICRYIAPRISG